MDHKTLVRRNQTGMDSLNIKEHVHRIQSLIKLEDPSSHELLRLIHAYIYRANVLTVLQIPGWQKKAIQSK